MNTLPNDGSEYSKWDNRHAILQRTMQQGKPAREALFKVWFGMISERMLNPKDLPDIRILDWQIEIGRALLDFPDMDRAPIAVRIVGLQGVRDRLSGKS